ncbi:MAG: IPTL-CTERM sorting domain-containing protein [Usitatibacter sp.]
MKKLLALFVLLLASVPASAFTYSYTGSPYGAPANFTVCGTGNCGNFAAAGRVTVQFVTPLRLPANLVLSDIGPLVTSFTSSDGLTTYASGDANVRVHSVQVSTDASGAVIDALIVVERWQVAGAVHAINDRLDFLQITPGFSTFAIHNAFCTGLGVSPAGTADSCLTAGTDTATSAGTGVPSAPIALLAAIAAQVPTLSEYALMLLAALMALAAVGALRRNGHTRA